MALCLVALQLAELYTIDLESTNSCLHPFLPYLAWMAGKEVTFYHIPHMGPTGNGRQLGNHKYTVQRIEAVPLLEHVRESEVLPQNLCYLCASIHSLQGLQK